MNIKEKRQPLGNSKGNISGNGTYSTEVPIRQYSATQPFLVSLRHARPHRTGGGEERCVTTLNTAV